MEDLSKVIVFFQIKSDYHYDKQRIWFIKNSDASQGRMHDNLSASYVIFMRLGRRTQTYQHH